MEIRSPWNQPEFWLCSVLSLRPSRSSLYIPKLHAVQRQLLGLSQRDFVYPGPYLCPGACCFLVTALVPHHEMTIICFLFPFGSSHISTLLLSAGLYACKEGSNSPCLVYVSFSQKIYIYWDVQLERMESTNLLKILDGDPEFESLLQQLDVGECGKSRGRTERKRMRWQMMCWKPEYFLRKRLSHCLVRMPNNRFSLFSLDKNDVDAVRNLIHKTLYFPEKYHLSNPSQDPAGTDSSTHCSGIQDPL